MKYVFVDETGDTGFKFRHGSSYYFAMGAVVFNDTTEINKAIKLIERLKEKLNWSDRSEFHYNRDSAKTKEKLQGVLEKINYDFFSYKVDKTDSKVSKNNLYEIVLANLFSKFMQKGDRCIIIFDQVSKKNLRQEITKIIKDTARTHGYVIKKVKFEDSRDNSILQMVDFVLGKNVPKVYS